jgi:hypothetical protein
MIVKALGIIDLLIALMIFAHTQLPKKVLVTIAFYLIIKGLFFVMLDDMVSFVDIGVGAYVLLLSIQISLGIFTVLAGLYLVQKGLLSLA